MRDFPIIRVALLLGPILLAAHSAHLTKAAVSQPSPGGFADGAFCTHGKGYFSISGEAAQRVQAGSANAAGTEIFTIGASPTIYRWQKTGTSPVPVGNGNNQVLVDPGVAALMQALGTGGSPGAFSTSAINATDMGTGGNLAAQTLTLSINLNFSERVVTPTGFQPLSLVGMEGVKLGGVRLTPAQASTLNGQAAVQVREAANAALGVGALPYGLSFLQLTELTDLLNSSFSETYKDANVVQPCGHASKFAQAHLYQPYITSNAFAGRRPASIALFTPKPTYNIFAGEVVPVGRGCPAGSISPGSPEDPYLDPAGNPVDPAGKIALIERGACRFDNKIGRATLAGATGVIAYNNAAGGEAIIVMGGNNPVTLSDGTVVNITIPATFVQRSTGLLLKNGTAPVTAFVQQ
jgi:hypothetical protein